MFGNFICLVLGHRINRHRVWHDGLDMRATCKHCRVPMIRTRYDWRPFDTATDGSRERNSHPRAH